MERRAQFNLAYLLFALIAMLALQQWWQRAQTVEVVPYSEFEKLLAEHRIDEVVIWGLTYRMFMSFQERFGVSA